MLALQNSKKCHNSGPENTPEMFRHLFYAGNFTPDNPPLSRRPETAYSDRRAGDRRAPSGEKGGDVGYARLEERMVMRLSVIQEVRNSGNQEFRNPGIQEFRNSGIQEFRNPGIQESGNSGIREFRNSGIQDSGIQEFGNSGIQEFRDSGIQEFRNSGI